MPHRAPRIRIFLAVVAAIQMALPFAAVMADARVDGWGDWIGIHVEEHPCSHDHGHPPDCLFCQVIAHPPLPAAVPVRLPVATSRMSSSSALGLAALSQPTCHLPHSRAPPLA